MMSGEDVKVRSCRVDVTPLGTTSSLDEAWRWLPDGGTGVVMLPDRVTRFDASVRRGLLIHADVVVDRTTVVLRMNGGHWQAWRWTESDGDSHKFVERAYRSSEPTTRGEPPNLLYRQYWTLKPDDEINIWQPIGARFCGFEEGTP